MHLRENTMPHLLITGGNKGIGLEVTRYFLQREYQITVVARDFSSFELAGHPRLTTMAFDLANTGQIPPLLAEVGPVDVLINNAGIMLSLPYDHYPPEQIAHILKINIEAPVAFINGVAKGMMARGAGRIVNNASIAGHIGHPDIWYGITKAGLLNATKSYAKLLGPHGIQINAVAASPVDTDMLSTIPEARKAEFKKSVVSGRFAQAGEIANTIGWLATEAPDYINGSCIDINGGSYLR